MTQSPRRRETERERWPQAVGQLVQAEVEKAVLQGLTAAFRTLAERLPQLLAEVQRPPTPPRAKDARDLPRVLRLPIPEIEPAAQTVEHSKPAEATVSTAAAAPAPVAETPKSKPRAATADKEMVPGRRERAESSRPTTPRPVDLEDSAHPAACRTPAPRPKTAPQDDLSLLPLTCPGCGAMARISWKRLDRLFRCRKCTRTFRVNREGRLADIDPHPGRSRRSRLVKRRVVPVAVLALLLVLAICLYPRFHRRPALAELPKELEARGQLWGKAWLNNDRLQLRRLTSPTHDRQLHPWLLRHPPPSPDRGTTAEQGAASPEIHLQILKPEPNEGILILHITAASLKTPRELRLDWVQRGDTWYFVPVLKR